MLDRRAVYRLQIAVLNRAVEDWMNPDIGCRRGELAVFFRDPLCEFLYNPFEGITLPEMLEVLQNGRLDYKRDAGRKKQAGKDAEPADRAPGARRL